MAVYDSIFTAGVHLRAALMASPAVTAQTKRIFPVVSRIDEKKPFVSFHRVGTDEAAIKSGIGPRSAVWQFQVFSSDWEEGLRIAEAIAGTLDGFRNETVRYCALEGASENFDYASDAYLQLLTFKVKV